MYHKSTDSLPMPVNIISLLVNYISWVKLYRRQCLLNTRVFAVGSPYL